VYDGADLPNSDRSVVENGRRTVAKHVSAEEKAR
jgi:hypothetical protein